jgi:hypothetical protein
VEFFVWLVIASLLVYTLHHRFPESLRVFGVVVSGGDSDLEGCCLATALGWSLSGWSLSISVSSSSSIEASSLLVLDIIGSVFFFCC